MPVSDPSGAGACSPPRDGRSTSYANVIFGGGNEMALVHPILRGVTQVTQGELYHILRGSDAGDAILCPPTYTRKGRKKRFGGAGVRARYMRRGMSVHESCISTE